jgi:hypothetical protein
MNQDLPDRQLSETVDIPPSVKRAIGKSSMDRVFRQKLLAEPADVLKAEGLELPDGVKVRVIEDTDKLMNLVIPFHLELDGELSDANLDKVSGGGRTIPTAKGQYS